MSTTVRAVTETRTGPLPILALRKRSAQHPMAMFVMMATVAFGTMALIPVSGSAFASLGVKPVARAPIVDTWSFAPDVKTTEKAARVASLSPTEIACAGQAWGEESAECLSVMAKESGRSDNRAIRMIADIQQVGTTPNIF
jgi:hypothetical protein